METMVRGQDIRFGRTDEEEPQEVSLCFRKTKTDQLASGEEKTLYLCPVEALQRMKRAWPNRFRKCHSESEQPLFRWSSGTALRRLDIQQLLQRAAEDVGLPQDRYMAHSLRIGGATALYQATSDIELVKRLGRWTWSAVHGYLEDDGTIADSSRRMADVRIQST